MRDRIGLEVTADRVRAVLVAGKRIKATATQPPGADAVARVLHELLGSGRKPFLRLRVTAALGPSLAPVKRLAGVPRAAAMNVVTDLLRANPARFFVGTDADVEVAAYRTGDSSWGTILKRSSIEAISQACAGCGVRLTSVVPLLGLIPMQRPDGQFELTEGHTRYVVKVAAGGLVEVRRADAGTELEEQPERQHLDGALAAARVKRNAALMISIDREAARVSRLVRVGLAAAAMMTVAAAVASPGLAAFWHLHQDARRLDSLNASSREWRASAQSLQRATTGLNTITAFAQRRRVATSALAAITEALPDSSAIVLLRMDSSGVSLTTLSTSAPRVLSRLSSLPGFGEPRIAGVVTREDVEGMHVQRTAVHLPFASTSRPMGAAR